MHVQTMQVVLGLYMMLFLEVLLLAIITNQQIQILFFWIFLISLFGPMFMLETRPGQPFHCFGVVSRFVKFRNLNL